MQNKREIYLIGMGPGSPAFLTAAVRERLLSMDAVAGAERTITVYREIGGAACEGRILESFRTGEILSFIEALPESCRRIGLLFTGALSVYSGARGMYTALREAGYPENCIHSCAGLSSLDYFLDQLHEQRAAVEVLSLHGRAGRVLPLLARTGKLLCLLGKDSEAAEIAAELLEFGLPNTEMVLGSCLTYPEERILRGKPEDFLLLKVSPLSLLYLRYVPGDAAVDASDFRTFGIADERFFRGERVPMTKQSIRAAVLSRLPLPEEGVVYDIGAGSGSVSVELSLHMPRGRVLAFESEKAALAVLEENRRRFLCGNLSVVPGLAPETLPDPSLPEGRPELVFIGGSRGRLKEIVSAVLQRNPQCSIAVTAVSMETESEILALSEMLRDSHAVQMTMLSVTEIRRRGPYHMRAAENPVLTACWTPIN